MLKDENPPKFNVAVFAGTWKRINALKEPTETMDDAINRVLNFYYKHGDNL